MDFRILGPLEVLHAGQLLDLGPHKQRSLLALLLIHVNRVVSTDHILDELWGDAAEGKENALWVYVSRLRSALEPDRVERGESSVLLTRDHGYMLSVDPESIDAHRFEAAAAEGRSLIRNDAAAAAAILLRGLQMWRGSALQDFAYDDFARTEITRLEELRLAAVMDRIEADLRQGQAVELIGELEALRQQHPLQERPVGQLMLALYRAGRQADALRTFERFRRYLGEELGVDPSPELCRLEEQVLLHDPRIQPRRLVERRPGGLAVAAVNPFKGLRPFHEEDSRDFFGRDRLVADVVRRLDRGERLIGLIGPSGSGKSSVVRAGLIPALRKGAITGSDQWLVAQMVPGSHPFAELEAALLRSSLDAPDSLTEQLADLETGILRAVLRVLPGENSRLLLVIDQLEELFTLAADDAERRRFLANLSTALDDPHGRIMVVLTLRADFYGRPLAYAEFGARLGEGVVNVVPMSPDEFEEAAQQPAERAGVAFEPALLAALLTDVVGQPGALPLFQYTLTELFDRRVGATLTLDSYRAMDGVRGALTRRADDLYAGLDPEQQAVAKQLFLRLVTIAEGTGWGRRRVPAAEILSLNVDVVALQDVIDVYTSHRLLTVDRDHVTGSPTVEVAHEALLTGWDRLSGWIEDSLEDVRRHESLVTAMNEWVEAGGDPDYLLSGTRLEVYDTWAATATMQLTFDERNYLDASLEAREQARAAEERAQVERERRRRYLTLVLAGGLVVAITSAVIAFNARGAAQREAAVNHSLVLAADAEEAFANGDTDLALALALEAVGTGGPPPEAIRTLAAVAQGPGTRAVLYGHGNGVRAAAMSPDARLALSGSCRELGPGDACAQGELILWDLDAESEAARFEGHTGWVNAVAFAPDGSTALSGSGDATLILWEVETGEVVRRFHGHTAGVNSVALDAAGETALSGSDDASLILWDVASGEVIRRFAGHQAGVNRVAFGPSGQVALSASEDATMILWDLATGEALRSFEAHERGVSDAAFLPDGGTILSVSHDFTLREWNADTGEELHRHMFIGNSTSLAITPDGRTALVSVVASLRQWDVQAHREVGRLTGHWVGADGVFDINSIAISEEGRLALSAGSDGTLRLWNLPGQDIAHRYGTDGIPLSAVAVSSDGSRLLAGRGDGEVILWDVERAHAIRSFRGEVAGVAPGCLAFSPDGRLGLVGSADVASEGGATSLALWDLETGREIRRLDGHVEYLRAVAFSPDGSSALAGSQSYPRNHVGDLVLWNLETGREIRRFDTTHDVTSIAVSADGSRAVSGSVTDRAAILWDVATGREVRRFDEHDWPVLDVAFGPDERTVLTATGDGKLLLLDLETGEVIRSYVGHESWVIGLDLSADGHHVISSSALGTVILWDFETGEELRRFTAHTGGAWDVAFHPDGRSAFSIGLDGELIRWHVADPPLDELIEWTHANRFVRELTCQERERYRIEPLSCE